MWTTRTANQVSLTFQGIALIVVATLTVAAGLQQDWTRMIITAVVGGVVTVVAVRRHLRRREGTPAAESVSGDWAADERGAAIQLRAWAVTGQIAVGALAVLATISVVLNAPFALLWLLLLLIAGHQLTVAHLSRHG
jgi:hypothetical protein